MATTRRPLYLTSAGVLAQMAAGDVISTAMAGAPAGGSTGQVLAKSSNTDYDYAWSSAGTGNVSTTGTPTVNQLAQWTDSTHVQGIDSISVSLGGTGRVTTTAYSVVLTGTTSTGAFKVDLGPGTAGQVLVAGGPGAYPSWTTPAAAPATVHKDVSAPTGTTSTTGVMMGLAASITPTGSGKIHIVITGDIVNSTNNRGGIVQIRYGTGSAPTNGAALTGTAVGGAVNMNNVNPSTANIKTPFSVTAVVTGLTPSTAYWIDVSLAAITSGTATIANVAVTALESGPSGAAGAGGDALTANPLSQFAATTSAQLAGVISDETGSGALVFGTSPTISSPSISGGTHTALTGLGIRSTGTGAFDLTLANSENLTAGRTLTIAVNNAARTLTVSADATVSGTNTGDISAANPTASVGLSAVNGSAGTWMRSDAAPALSQSIAPTWTGVHNFAVTARTSGVASYFKITAPADTGQTAATESVGVDVVGATRTWADGTVATQREYLFRLPTYNKTTTSATFTKAATVAITGAPAAGTGVTITNAYALWVQAGKTQLDDTTASTSTTTGALVSAGGLGVAKSGYFGETVFGKYQGDGQPTGVNSAFWIGSAASATSDLLGFGSGSRGGVIRGYQDGGGIIQWQFHGGSSGGTYYEYLRLSGSTAGLSTGTLSVYPTTASTSPTTGAVVVTGGVGIGGTLSTTGRIAAVSIKTTGYTLTTSDHVVVCNSATAFTLTMIAASSNTGRMFVLKNKNTGLITVDATSLGQIDGLYNTITLDANSTAILVSDGTTWNRI